MFKSPCCSGGKS